MRKAGAMVALLFLLSCTSTPDGHSLPVVAPLQSSVVLDAEILGSRIHIPASIDGQPPGTFILDTGASASPLAAAYAAEIGIKPSRKGVSTGAAGSLNVDVATDVPVRVGAIDTTLSSMALLPLENVSLRTGRRINGVLGYELLQRFTVIIDYERGRVTFEEPNAFTRPPDAVEVPLSFYGRLPIAHARIALPDGRTFAVRMLIDTGAGLAVRLNRPFVQGHAISLPNAIESSLGMGIGGATSERTGRAKSVEFGGFVFDEPVMALSNDTKGMFADPNVDGVIGGIILRRFTLICDYPRKRLLLVPNSRLHDAFDFETVGAIVASTDLTFRTMTIRDVLPGSPADEAGVRAGDLLVAVDGRPVTGTDVERIRNDFRRVGVRYELTISREGVERVVPVTSRRIV